MYIRVVADAKARLCVANARPGGDGQPCHPGPHLPGTQTSAFLPSNAPTVASSTAYR